MDVRLRGSRTHAAANAARCHWVVWRHAPSREPVHAWHLRQRQRAGLAAALQEGPADLRARAFRLVALTTPAAVPPHGPSRYRGRRDARNATLHLELGSGLRGAGLVHGPGREQNAITDGAGR
eukprot:scaffold104588_cov62-Phaeocystis_antarctica.AAC.2